MGIRRALSGWKQWRQIALYGAALAVGVLLLEWIDYQRLARTNSSDIWLFLVAAGFLGLGIYLGARVLRAPAPRPFDGNPQVRATLGISDREIAVLTALAEGRSNREIADALHVSPNTVKTHLANLYAKLEANRRTDAVAKARALGILP
ncbi:helix-turn-helix transcriptional regulator [Stakelama tenebrarum]|uniref:Response regulator transcription factor n=1 Tax=Stakelama tenebrarum TaxID=2711215 RepID=A0A6G6Y176_9SPHN|nr:response regulator transcription factor [Sphingosinithalassobacter tenebrarum]QIG78694.1 response regulator transcription factor [Sphingosinithalassobacter tenebrarum]